MSAAKKIVEIIADGLDASVDGRGFSAEHLRATTLANAAPKMLVALECIASQAAITAKTFPNAPGRGERGAAVHG